MHSQTCNIKQMYRLPGGPEYYPKLYINDTVTWTSTSNGTTKIKLGTVRVVVPPRGATPIARGGRPRNHRSYVIHVYDDKGNRTVYWPRVSVLKKVTEH